VDSPSCLANINDIEIQRFRLVLQRAIFGVPGHRSRSNGAFGVVREAARDQPFDLAHVLVVEIDIEFLDLERIVDEPRLIVGISLERALRLDLGNTEVGKVRWFLKPMYRLRSKCVRPSVSGDRSMIWILIGRKK
jgi:hypothetical protein